MVSARWRSDGTGRVLLAAAGDAFAGFGALTAAICSCHGAALTTRNVSDFDGTGVEGQRLRINTAATIWCSAAGGVLAEAGIPQAR